MKDNIQYLQVAKFKGISDGLVGSDACGFCENCAALPTGTEWYEMDGITWCRECLSSFMVPNNLPENNTMIDTDNDNFKFNKKNIFFALKARGISTVDMEYSGSGDSGSLEDPIAFDSDNKIKKLSGEILFIPPLETWNPKSQYDEPKPLQLWDAIKEFGYTILEATYPGWEINEGSNGTLCFDVEKEKISWDHTTAYTEYETTSQVL